MDDGILISVIVPVYNVEKYVEKCIESVLDQTYARLEVLLVDDGSTDRSGAICDVYANKDNRIKVIHKRNGGLSSARNAGIQAARGEWLLFIDSDDFIAPEMVKKLYDVAQKKQAMVAFCGVEAFIEDEQGIREVEFWTSPPVTVRSGQSILKEAVEQKSGVLGGHHVIACNKIYHRSVFEQLRYPEGQVHEDEAIAHYILHGCEKIASISDRLYYYRQRNDSIMGNHENPVKLQSINLAYGDRILFYDAQGYVGDLQLLYNRYWKTLLGNWHGFYRDYRCTLLRKRLRKQMRDVKRLYMSMDYVTRKDKIGVALFCIWPRGVSAFFAWSVKLRSKDWA